MALRQIVVAEKIKEKEAALKEIRQQRTELISRKNLLEDEINAAETDEQRKEIEKKVDEFVIERDKNDESIKATELELEELREEQRRLNEKSPKNVRVSGRLEKEEIYKDMENIILRNGDSLFDIRSEIFDSEQRNLNLGKYVRGMVTGRWDNADNERSAMLTSGASSLIPSPLYAKILDKARNISVFTAANVPVVEMETNNLTVAKIKEDLKAAFKAEGNEATESTPLELEGVTLTSKTIYGYAYVSLEAIESAQNLDAVLADSFGKAVAEGIDQGMLYGVYSGSAYQDYAPAGIFNNDGINSITAAHSDYDDIIKAIGRIRANNGIASTMAINANTEEVLSLLKDGNGQYLTPPRAISDINQFVSNQLSYDAAEGSDLLVFDPNALLIGVQQGINIKVFDGDTECIKKGLVCFRVMSMIDCVVLQPKHISRITGFGKSGQA
ncbi:phage major capsid protein [Faecalicatena contorta]|uniref:phage major capsid protein n=1 Tax=Faecalicatena contorta TaxID=39482 RepID=UPI0031DC261E